jgi:hypothetical protein
VRWLGVYVVGLSSSIAFAQAPTSPSPATSPSEYPVEEVDRPLVMLDGMSELALGYSYRHDADDAVSIHHAHSLGRVELFATLTSGPVYAGARVAVTRDFVASLSIGGQFGSHADGGNVYLVDPSLLALYRIARIPRRLAVYVDGGARAQALRARNVDGTYREGVDTRAEIGASTDVQLTRNFAAFASASVGALLHSTAESERDVWLGASTGLQFSLLRWDFVAGVGLADLTDTRQFRAFASIAFRWGM